jgi:hypothetical protein
VRSGALHLLQKRGRRRRCVRQVLQHQIHTTGSVTGRQLQQPTKRSACGTSRASTREMMIGSEISTPRSPSSLRCGFPPTQGAPRPTRLPLIVSDVLTYGRAARLSNAGAPGVSAVGACAFRRRNARAPRPL